MTKPKRERIVFVPDVQIPGHDPRAIALFCKVVKEYIKPDRAIFLGDVINFDIISKHSKERRDPSMAEELEGFHKVMKQLCDALGKKCRKQYIRGNHSERLEKYLWAKAPELAELPQFSLRSVLDLQRYNIEGPVNRIELCNKKFVAVHGHPYCGSQPGSTAKRWLDAEGRSGICGHIHRLCLIGRTLYNETLVWAEGGSLCKNPLPYLNERKGDWQIGWCWGMFGEKDFALFEIRPHTNMTWVSPEGKEWRA
jgi:hypothetical protein